MSYSQRPSAVDQNKAIYLDNESLILTQNTGWGFQPDIYDFHNNNLYNKPSIYSILKMHDMTSFPDFITYKYYFP